MEQKKFADWDLDGLDKAFGLEQILEKDCEVLQKWETLAKSQEISDFEKQTLFNLQEPLQWAGKAWNEFELENKFISPVIMASKIDDRVISYFLERSLTAIVGDYELSGTVDGMIAKGFRNPDMPFFCLHEYAPTSPKGTYSLSPHWGDERGASGNPDAQALAAMLVAREMNQNKKPIYGLYIVGLIWNFMVLDANQYCISRNYDSSTEGIFDIFKMLKALRHVIKTELL